MTNDGITREPRPDALAEIVAGSAIGVLGLDTQLRILVVNDYLAGLVGVTAESLTGRSAHEALHGPGAEANGCTFRLAADAAEPVEVEGDAFRTADGSLVPVTWIAAPLSGGGTSVIVRDDSVQRARAVIDAAVREQGRAELAEARQSVAELEWLAELAQTLSSTLDEDEVLLRLARVVAGRLADVVVVDRYDDAVLRRVGGAVRTGLDVDLDAVLAADPDGPIVPRTSPSYELAQRGQILHLTGSQIDDPELLGERSRAILAGLDAQSVLVVPLTARERVVGVVAFVRCSGSPGFDDTDRLQAVDIGRRAALAVDNARLYREQREAALQLQVALLPPPSRDLPVGTAVRYLPARSRYHVGGDWYDQFECPDDRRTTVLVVGDVAGHDLPAATTMAAIRNLVRGITVATDSSCAGVITTVDANLAGLGVTGTASLVVMTAHPEDDGWTLSWSSAGHLPPMLLLPDGSAELLEARHGPILGTGAAPPRTQSDRRVPFGSTVVLYTDGLVETRVDDLDTGLARLRQSAIALAGLRAEPEALLEHLVDRNRTADEDDTAILVCHLPDVRPAG